MCINHDPIKKLTDHTIGKRKRTQNPGTNEGDAISSSETWREIHFSCSGCPPLLTARAASRELINPEWRARFAPGLFEDWDTQQSCSIYIRNSGVQARFIEDFEGSERFYAFAVSMKCLDSQGENNSMKMGSRVFQIGTVSSESDFPNLKSG
jgi:hypothetical protein